MLRKPVAVRLHLTLTTTSILLCSGGLIVAHHTGKITINLLQREPTVPSAPTYRARFGSLSRAYQLIGYRSWPTGWIETRRRIQSLRSDLMNKIVALNPTRIEIEDRGNGYRTRLRTHEGRLLSVVASRPRRVYNDAISWLVKPSLDERHLITLVARLSLRCDDFKDMFLIPPIGKATTVYLRDRDPRLRNAMRVIRLEDFCGTVKRFRSQMQPMTPA